MVRLLFLALFVFAAAPAQADKMFNAETFTLQNGMQVVVIPNHRAPVVSHMVWYKVGAADERRGKSGIAHFLEHLMFKGTPSVPDGTFSQTVKKLGGNDNAFTSQDFTAYYENVGKPHLRRVMEMEADRMRNLILSEEQVASERQVIMEERRQRVDNQPQARFMEQAMAMLFVNHPYATPIIGWMHEIKNLTREDAFDFYRRWYAPNNAILIVSGDITAKELKPLAEETYGKVERGPNLLPRLRARPAPLLGMRRLILEDPQVGRPTLHKIWRAPRGSQAAEILAEVLGGSSTSRLYRSLVIEQKVALAAGADYDPVKLDDTTFSVYAVPTPGTTMNDLELAIDREIASFLENGATAAEIRDAKERQRARATYFLDSLQGPAMLFGRALASGFDVGYVESWRDRIARVTLEDVSDIADKILSPANPPVIGLLLPVQKTEAKK